MSQKVYSFQVLANNFLKAIVQFLLLFFYYYGFGSLACFLFRWISFVWITSKHHYCQQTSMLLFTSIKFNFIK